MHKPSEYTENTANLLKEMCDSAYDEEEFATILGGPEVGAEFSSLILITCSTQEVEMLES